MKPKPYTCQRWGVLWRTKNRLDGQRESLQGDGDGPVLFHSRREAREHINQRYGYIAKRPDLRSEPHGWRMPVAVRVIVEIHYARPT